MELSNHIPKIAIIGRPNVGKSTLFNAIINKRKAIVQSEPATTRDRISEVFEHSGVFLEIVDTGGLDFNNRDKDIPRLVERQVISAIKSADTLLFVCDVKTGILPLDQRLTELIRKFNKPVILVVNKVDNKNLSENVLEFYRLGLGEPIPISSTHKSGIIELLDVILRPYLGNDSPSSTRRYSIPACKKQVTRLAIVGKPNAGKSLFINTLIGEERLIVSSEPGTTRDSIDIYFEMDSMKFIIIDTAGIRAKTKVKDAVTYFSILRTEQTIKKSDVCIILIDGIIGITKEDYKIISFVQGVFKPFVLAINKWDLCIKENYDDKEYEAVLRKTLRFIYNAPIIFTSALTSTNVIETLEIAHQLVEKAKRNFSTSLLNELLKGIVITSTRLYSIRQLNNSPIEFEVITKNPEVIQESQKNFIVNRLRERLELDGVPIKMRFRKKK